MDLKNIASVDDLKKIVWADESKFEMCIGTKSTILSAAFRNWKTCYPIVTLQLLNKEELRYLFGVAIAIPG